MPRRPWIILLCLLCGACATPRAPLPDPHALFDDALVAPRPVIAADAVFALSDEMKRYLARNFFPRGEWIERSRVLAKSLRGDSGLKLSYDAGSTRTAAEAFADRAGNCLSLVIMTSALARAMNIEVRYFRVLTPDVWSRDGDLLLANQHVNVSFGGRSIDRQPGDLGSEITIDFMPPDEVNMQLRSEIDENTVLAMFFNNRAAEHLVARQFEDAYWHARAAMLADPRYLPAYNTLGVAYLRLGRLPQAERVFAYAERLDPENPDVLTNLEHVYRGQGRHKAADQLAERLRQLEPTPPYHHFLVALNAMQRGDFTAAHNALLRELRREPYNHEVLFGLAIVAANLGDMKAARRYLTEARDNSTTRRTRELYAAKLERLRPPAPR